MLDYHVLVVKLSRRRQWVYPVTSFIFSGPLSSIAIVSSGPLRRVRHVTAYISSRLDNTRNDNVTVVHHCKKYKSELKLEFFYSILYFAANV